MGSAFSKDGQAPASPMTSASDTRKPQNDSSSKLSAPFSSGDSSGSQSKSASTETPPSTLIPLLVLTAVSTLALQRVYRRFLRRIPTAPAIPPSYLRRRSLFGTVTSVGDGDNFRLYHTPGGRLLGWGWFQLGKSSSAFRRLSRRIPTSRQDLKNQTIHIRLAGVDAPELPHFGQPGQPGGDEAIEWLRNYVLGRRVRCWVYRKDQYERVVATVKVWRFPGLRRDVGAEMLRRGLATVYEARTGQEFGGRKTELWYRRLEEMAKRKRRGIWGLGEEGRESPREFKTRVAHEAEAEKEVNGGDEGQDGRERGWGSWIGSWFTGRKDEQGGEKRNRKERRK